MLSGIEDNNEFNSNNSSSCSCDINDDTLNKKIQIRVEPRLGILIFVFGRTSW
jgi:hypothetical protein